MNNLTEEERDKITEKVNEYISLLYVILHKVGRLDDLYESPLIDSRMPPGAYQYITRAIDHLDGYLYEVGEYENS